ncbi:MAG: hypothetical protein HY323_05320 [Betaproteobacteria bacterium]|nr:hypothetical protein [Betaproteobacteria bacterium]
MSERLPRYLAAGLCALTLLVLARPSLGADPPATFLNRDIYDWAGEADRRGAELERARAALRLERRRVRRLQLQVRKQRRDLHHRVDPSLRYGILLASVVYRQSAAALRRVAWCESRFYLWARSPGGNVGPFQFAPATWAGTPFARFSPFDPVASSLATGWMWQRGRKNDWSCA